MHFDPRAAKALQPGNHIVIDGCQGLRLTATASRKTFIYRYKDDSGKMKQIAIGQWPAISAQAAVAKWQELRDQRNKGVDPREQRALAKKARSGADDQLTVRKLVQDFIDGPLKESRQPAGYEAARRALASTLDKHPDFADCVAAKVSRGVAFSVLDARKATPMAALKLRSLLGAAWEHAHDCGLLDGNAPNWWRQLMHGKLKTKGRVIGGEHVGPSRRVLRPDEVAKLIEWLPNMHANGRDGVILYLWTGTRGAEIFGMHASHITQEADGWWWTIPKELTKNRREKHAVDMRVPLFGRALQVVQHRLKNAAQDGRLFHTQDGEPYQQHTFSTYIYSLQPYSEKVGRREGDGLILPVTHWTPHNLRRTARTLLAQLGCPNEIGEAILGHMPPEILATYNAHTYDAERKQWLSKLSDYLEILTA